MLISVPKRLYPTCKSGRFRSDFIRIRHLPLKTDRIRWGCCRILFSRNSSESHKNLTRSDMDFVGFRRIPTKSVSDSDEFRQNPRRIPTEKNPTTTLSGPTAIIWIRQDPTPHGSPGSSFKRSEAVLKLLFPVIE